MTSFFHIVCKIEIQAIGELTIEYNKINIAPKVSCESEVLLGSEPCYVP